MPPKFYWALLVALAVTRQSAGQALPPPPEIDTTPVMPPNAGRASGLAPYSEGCSELHPTKPKEAGPQLSTAASAGNANRVKSLLASVKFNDCHLQNALGAAAFSGHADVAELLLNAGARKHRKRLGTALVAAAEQGHAEIVKLLLDAGADPDAWFVHHADFTKPWPQAYANKKGIPALFPGEMFRGSSSVGEITITITPDHPAADVDLNVYKSGGRVQIIPSGVYNISGAVPQTALVMAAENGHTEVVKLLLAAGAHRGGRSQLYMGLLVQPGSKLEQWGFPNYHMWAVNETALEAAKQANQKEVVDLLTLPGPSRPGK